MRNLQIKIHGAHHKNKQFTQYTQTHTRQHTTETHNTTTHTFIHLIFRNALRCARLATEQHNNRVCLGRDKPKKKHISTSTVVALKCNQHANVSKQKKKSHLLRMCVLVEIDNVVVGGCDGDGCGG
jgi:hypothetical protein